MSSCFNGPRVRPTLPSLSFVLLLRSVAHRFFSLEFVSSPASSFGLPSLWLVSSQLLLPSLRRSCCLSAFVGFACGCFSSSRTSCFLCFPSLRRSCCFYYFIRFMHRCCLLLMPWYFLALGRPRASMDGLVLPSSDSLVFSWLRKSLCTDGWSTLLLTTLYVSCFYVCPAPPSS